MVLYSRLGAHATTWIAIGGAFAVAIAAGLWLAYRRYRYTFWKLDRDGFAVKRGRLWQWETRVPTTRVQHMDLKRGPLERAHGLASVILHTAGTRLSAVSVSGMSLDDAERLRDYLTRQIDRQDGDDSDHA
ncbi:MAG: PH domain-containing protein [Xanthomonadaceae bacterium]|nr:PH domain-containing protein [Xanthomonadaceae bacterium]